MFEAKLVTMMRPLAAAKRSRSAGPTIDSLSEKPGRSAFV
jgi:hypothetical protein